MFNFTPVILPLSLSNSFARLLIGFDASLSSSSSPFLPLGLRSSPVSWSTSRMDKFNFEPAIPTSFTHTLSPLLTQSAALATIRVSLVSSVKWQRPSLGPSAVSMERKAPYSITRETLALKMAYSSTGCGPSDLALFIFLALRLRLRFVLLFGLGLFLPPLPFSLASLANSSGVFSLSNKLLAVLDSSVAGLIISCRSGLSGIANPGNIDSFTVFGARGACCAGAVPPFSLPVATAPLGFGAPIFWTRSYNRSQNGLAAEAPFSSSFCSNSSTLFALSPISMTNSAKVLSSIPQ
mmetsp:Transcript_99412/g.157272  ORF Transcript_99412/g.157272 Transcript_99412/m.157272 type:complete len:294 (+) Transcript_99412:2545-3426(+)